MYTPVQISCQIYSRSFKVSSASRDSHEIAFAFHVYIQKSIEERFPGVSIPLEVQAWVLYYISAMRCEDD